VNNSVWNAGENNSNHLYNYEVVERAVP